MQQGAGAQATSRLGAGAASSASAADVARAAQCARRLSTTTHRNLRLATLLLAAVVVYACMSVSTTTSSSTEGPWTSVLRQLLTKGGASSTTSTELCDPRSAAATAAGNLTNLRWHYLPKCGTSLGTTLLRHACPSLPASANPEEYKNDMEASWELRWFEDTAERYCAPGALAPVVRYDDTLGKFRAHVPMYDYDARHASTVVMLRDPRRRLVSAFNHKRLSFAAHEEEAVKAVEATKTVRELVEFPGIAGCQMRMLSGKYRIVQVWPRHRRRTHCGAKSAVGVCSGVCGPHGPLGPVDDAFVWRRALGRGPAQRAARQCAEALRDEVGVPRRLACGPSAPGG